MNTTFVKLYVCLLGILLNLTTTHAQTNHSSSLTANNNDGELIWTPDLSNIAPTTSPQKKSKSECDVIELKNGDEILANITANEPWVVKYRKCGKSKGNPLTLSKKHIKNIKFANGKILDVEKELADRKEASENYKEPTRSPNYNDDIYERQSNNNDPLDNNTKPKTDALAVVGLVSSIAAFFIAGFILGGLGVVLGIISSQRIIKNKERLKGKAVAFLAVLFGVIAIFLTLIAISLII